MGGKSGGGHERQQYAGCSLSKYYAKRPENSSKGNTNTRHILIYTLF